MCASANKRLSLALPYFAFRKVWVSHTYDGRISTLPDAIRMRAAEL